MTRTLADFIPAIRANIDDDTPRLIAADWLEEQGQAERAEFIRAQCELAKMTCSHMSHPEPCCYEVGSPDGSKCGRLRQRDFSLGGRLPATKVIHENCEGWGCRRGFIEVITCTATNWLAHADAILREHPVREVRLTTRLLPLHCRDLRWPDIKFMMPPLAINLVAFSINREALRLDEAPMPTNTTPPVFVTRKSRSLK